VIIASEMLEGFSSTLQDKFMNFCDSNEFDKLSLEDPEIVKSVRC